MKRIFLLLAMVLLCSLPARAFTGCQNLTLLNGWTCIDTNAVSGAGTNPTNLSLVHGSGVLKGDLIVSWGNLVTATWTTQTLGVTDNAGNTFTFWSLGMRSYSNPINQWVGGMFYTVATANKASGYVATCTAVANGGTAPRCDDFSVVIIRPPAPLASVAEDITPIFVPPASSTQSTGTGGSHPNMTVPPTGQTITTLNADIIIAGGNTDQATAFVDSPFIGMDGDGTLNVPFYYLAALTQSVAGSANFRWYVSGGSTSVGSGMLALKPTFATNAVFLTQSGGGTGASCGSPQSFAYFNNAANWSSTPTGTQIGPGTTAHICSGTYTGSPSTVMLAFQGNGISGNPVTLLFDSGAVLQETVFQKSFNGSPCGGGISMCGHSFITVDGGSNGLMQNTANGDLLANQLQTTFIDAYSCQSCKVLRLTGNNAYVHVQNNTTLPGTQYGDERCIALSGSNWEVAYNSFDQAGWCIYFQYANGDTTNRIHDNFIGHYAHGIMYATTGHGSHGQDVFIYNNHFQTTRNWSVNPPSCPGHQDGIHMFGTGTTGGAQSTMDGQYIYNNLFDGQMGGACDTGNIFIEAGSLTTGTPSTATSTYIWNNIFDASGSIVGGGGTGTGWCSVFGHNETTGSGTHVLYNTLIYNGDVDNGQGYNIGSVDNLTFQGNVSWKISMGANIGSLTNTPASQINYNTYAGACTGNCFIQNGSFKSTFSAWKAGLGWDTLSQAPTNAAVKLNTDGTPQTGSLVIKQGINLGSQATGNLITMASDTTAGGSRTPLPRPSTASCTTQGNLPCWDEGAYMFNTSGAAPPTASPVAGAYGPSQSVTLSTTLGTVICYTTNGTTPATNGTTGCTTGTLYAGAISVTTTTTIKAVAGGTGLTDSAVSTFAYTINGTAATPTFSPVAGTYSGSVSVTISTASGPLTFCYTTNGSTPAATVPGTCDAGSTTYSGPVTISTTSVLKAIATSSQWINSAVGSASYTIIPNVATPTFSPVGGTYSGTQSVVITTSTGSATICYTIDGSTPTADGAGNCTHGTSGTPGTSTASLSVLVSETVKAIGTKSGLGDSTVGSAAYVINFPTPVPPATIMLVAVPPSAQPVVQGINTVTPCTDATKPCAFRVACSPCSASTLLIVDGKVSTSAFTPGFVSGTAMPGPSSHQISLINP